MRRRAGGFALAGRAASRRTAGGFTLPELMAVLAIAAIVLAVAAPNLRDLVRAQQLKAAANDLFGAVGLARAQALARNARVRVAPLDPAGVDWTSGWAVTAEGQDGLDVIAVHGPLPAGVTAAFAFTTPAPPYYIAYNGAGRSCSDSSSAQARWGTLSLFSGEHARRIKINMLGRARLCDPQRDSTCDGAAAPP